MPALASPQSVPDYDDLAHHNQALESLWKRAPFLTLEAGLDAIAEHFAMPKYKVSRDELRQRLEYLQPGSSEGKTAEELAEIGWQLGAPGSMHTAGWLVDFVYHAIGADVVDGKILAAAMRAHWHGGKVGFSFLPRVTEMDDPEDYGYQAQELVEFLRGDYGNWLPDDLMVNGEYDRDLDFYNSLPDRLTVYRGAPGIDVEFVSRGVCWTTVRDIAEWFARRGAEPHTVVSAQVRKVSIATAFDSECEVIVSPYRWREIKCYPRREGWRPEMKWSKR